MNPKLLFLLLFITISTTAQNKNKTIGFKENKGQIVDQKGKPNNAVKYLLNSGGLNVQLRKNGFSYDVYEAKKHPINHSNAERKKPLPFPSKDDKELPDYTLEYQYHRIDIDFVNSNPKVELLTEQKSADYDNYYNVPNKPEGIVGVYQYKQVTYKNIYPNIDVVFLVPKDTLKTVEYNFVVHPKGKISDIQLKFSGAQTKLVNNKIQMSVRFGEMEETLPASWTEDGELKKEIAVGYTKIKKNVYGFKSAENVSDKTVIIDPVPTRLWGTFYGDQRGIHFSLNPSSISTDSSGNIYMTGDTTASNSSYATTGAHQTSIPYDWHSVSNGIIVKFSSDGNRLWGTYYGGIGFNIITDVKIDFQNNVVVVGSTEAQSNISTLSSYQPNLRGGFDTFLVKFNDSGIRLWGTYFGGDRNDFASSLDIDKNNNIFIAGNTSSQSNIAINSNFQTQLNQVQDVFDNIDGLLAKFDAGGNLIWSTYVGGESWDELKTIVVKDNYLITGGFTESYNNISTPGVFQERHDPIRNSEGTVYKFSLDGKRIWSTYYGGEQVDYVHTVEADNENNIYIGGKTASNNNITTPNSFDSTSTYSYNGFFAKLNSFGERIWGSYLGEATVYSIIFRNNSIYVGATNGGFHNQKLTNACSYRPNADFEGYVGKFSKQGDFIWGTYIGNDESSTPTKITLDHNNNIFVSGISSQNNGIANSSSHQSSVYGFYNYFLMKFSEGNLCNINITPKSNSPICITNTLSFSDVPSGYQYNWTGPNGFTSNVQNPIINNVNTTNNGLYTLIVSDGSNCACKMTYKLDVVVGDTVSPIPNLTTLPTITGDCRTSITTIPRATDACAGAITATTASPLSYSLPGTYTVVWDYNDGNGNSSHQNQTVTISNQPLPTATSPQTFCILQNAILTNIAITGQNIKWYDQLTTGNLLSNTTPLQNGKTYYASQTINGCESERIPVIVHIQNTAAPIGIATQNFCSSQNPTLSNLTVAGTAIKWYDNTTLGNLLTATTPLSDGITYYASQTLNNCESPRFGVTVSIVTTPNAPTGNANQSFCKSENATISNITINGQNIKWYYSTTATTVLANTELLTNNTYFASQTVGCESDRTAISVQVNDTPKPTANNNQLFCIDENTTIGNLNISGTAIKWYDLASNGTVLPETTLLQNGIYYATQTLNNCESERLGISVQIQDTQIPIANSLQTFCIQKNAKISDIAISGQNIQWFESSISPVNLSESTALENAKTYYASQTIGNCEGQRIPVTINILAATTEECINFEEELPFPKFFTPNDDRHNDFWTIDTAYLAPNSGIRIYDRYGKLIKELGPDSSWDGTYVGQLLPASDYWFTVTRKNGTEYKGHFSLIR